MATQNDNFRIEAGKHIDDRYTKLGVPYVDTDDVNATIAISRRYRGLTILIGALEYWYRDGINDVDLIIKTSASIAGGSASSGKFLFSTDITGSDPGDGKLKFNNGSPGSVTEIYINGLTTEGVDIGAVLENLATGDEFRVQVAADDDNNVKYKLLGPAVDNSGWWTLSVEFKSFNGGFFADLEPIVATVIIGGTGGVVGQGISEEDGIIKLGGDNKITESRVITVLNGLLSITGDYDTGTSVVDWFIEQVEGAAARLQMSGGDPVSGEMFGIVVDPEAISSQGGLRVIDTRAAKKGIELDFADYSGLTDDSLVPKAYVDDVLVDFNIDGGVATSIYNTLPVVDGGGP